MPEGRRAEIEKESYALIFGNESLKSNNNDTDKEDGGHVNKTNPEPAQNASLAGSKRSF